MCNRSVGLIARAIEAVGIPTTSISLTKDLTLATGVPRAVYIKWPLGHPLGEAGNRAQQRQMIFDALLLLKEAEKPGVLAEPGYRWKREKYMEPDWSRLG